MVQAKAKSRAKSTQTKTAVKKAPSKRELETQRLARERTFRLVWSRLRLVLKVALVIVLFGGGYHYYRTGEMAYHWERASLRLMQHAKKLGLSLNTIEISGVNKLSEEEILQLFAMDAYGNLRELPIMAIDLPQLSYRIEKLGWVKTVSIERRLPNILRILVQERVPKAIWQHEGVLHLVDEAGIVITTQGVEEYNYLPNFVGVGADAYIQEMLKLLESEPALMPRVESLTWVGERRWDVKFYSGVVAKLPEDYWQVAWEKLAALQDETQVLDRAIEYIDLRDSTKVPIKPL